jgi:hypothetical protein
MPQPTTGSHDVELRFTTHRTALLGSIERVSFLGSTVLLLPLTFGTVVGVRSRLDQN